MRKRDRRKKRKIIKRWRTERRAKKRRKRDRKKKGKKCKYVLSSREQYTKKWIRDNFEKKKNASTHIHIAPIFAPLHYQLFFSSLFSLLCYYNVVLGNRNNDAIDNKMRHQTFKSLYIFLIFTLIIITNFHRTK